MFLNRLHFNGRGKGIREGAAEKVFPSLISRTRGRESGGEERVNRAGRLSVRKGRGIPRGKEGCLRRKPIRRKHGREKRKEERPSFFCVAERTVLSLLSFGALLFLLFFVIGSAANMWYEEEQLPGRKDLCGLLLLYGVTDMISAVAVCLLSPANRKKRGKGVRPVSGGQPVVRLFVLGALLRIGEIFSLYAYVFVFRFETVNFFVVFHSLLLFVAAVLFFAEGGAYLFRQGGKRKKTIKNLQ